MNYENKILNLFKNGYLNTKDVVNNNIPRFYLTKLIKDSKIERVSRGVYTKKNELVDEFVILQSKSKNAIYSNTTALYLYGLSNRIPIKYDITINNGYNGSLQKNNNVNLFYIKKDLLDLGVVDYKLDSGNIIKVYDLDTTIKGLPLDKETITKVINEIINIDLNDNVKLEIENIKDIREEELYSGFNVNLKASFDGLKTNLMIDITTGDIITYKEVKYEYKTLFDNEVINIMSYNYETILAEKFESIISRNIDNTRMKDYYDLYMFVNLKWNDINKDTLRKAIINTAKNRGTLELINGADKYLELISDDNRLKSLWNSYQNNYEYAKDISFDDTIKSIKVISELIVLVEI